MKNKVSKNKQGGFLKIILIIVLALVVLGYFGFNLENIINSPTVHSNLQYVWDLAVTMWNKFLVVPATFIWDKIVIGIVWDSLLKLISMSHGG